MYRFDVHCCNQFCTFMNDYVGDMTLRLFILVYSAAHRGFLA